MPRLRLREAVGMTRTLDKARWDRALERSIDETAGTFRARANEIFWREYDLQSYLYSTLFKESMLQPYVRREHRIWYREKPKQLLVADLALLDPESMDVGYPYWPVREIIQLKYPVEFKTGLTAPATGSLEEGEKSSPRHREAHRRKIRSGILEDYDKYVKAVDVARNIADVVRCRILYFDTTDEPAYASNEEFWEDLREKTNMNPTHLGPWPLVVSYYPASPRSGLGP